MYESEMDTEGGVDCSQTATDNQSRHKERKMTNIYLTDSDKEIIVDFAMKSFLTKPTTCLRTRLGRIACEKECKEQQAVSERAQDLVQILKNLL